MSGADLLRAFFGMALALAFVLALAFLVIWLLRQAQDRRLGSAARASSEELRFLRALPLGPRERAVLVSCGGERMLLGVAAGGVTLLARWPEPPADEPE